MPLRSAALAAPATARSMAWGPLAGAGGALAVAVVAQRPWDGHPLTLGFARVAAAVAVVASTYSLDDAAASTLAASPTALAARRGVRVVIGLLGALALIALAAASVATLAGAGTTSLPAGRLALETLALSAVAMACSATLGGDRGAGAVAAGLLVAVLVQHRWPALALFPVAPGSPGWSSAGVAWALIGLGGVACLLGASRDPCRRSLAAWNGIRRRRWPRPASGAGSCPAPG